MAGAKANSAYLIGTVARMGVGEGHRLAARGGAQGGGQEGTLGNQCGGEGGTQGERKL